MHTVDFITALFTASIMLCAKGAKVLKVRAISKDISLLWLVLGIVCWMCFPCLLNHLHLKEQIVGGCLEVRFVR
jgi:hypothetical protein